MLSLSEDAAVVYLLTRHAAMFKLKIKSTDAMSGITVEDGSCWYRAVRQAAQRVLIPIIDRVGAPVDISYKDDSDRFCKNTMDGRSRGRLAAPC